ncbi:MAG: hypothetical protein ABWZ52_01180, partial [Acidimicrobiales bacterium]
ESGVRAPADDLDLATDGGAPEVGTADGRSGSLTVAEGAAWAALTLAAVVLPLFRARSTPMWRSMWGEDAWMYVPQAIQDGPLANLFRGHGGYTHLPDRLLAAPMAFLPIEWAAPYFAVAPTLIAAAVGLFTAHLARAWIPSRLLQAALVMGMVLTPVAGSDITANVINLVWVYAAALPFVLASTEERTRDVIGRSVLAFAAATGSIVSVVFIPLALGWAIYRRTRAAITVVTVFGVGLLIQAVASRFAGSATGLPPQRSLVDLSQLVEARVFAAPLVGAHQASAWWQDHGQLFLLAATAVMLAALALVGWGATASGRVVGGILVLHAVAVMSFLALGRGTNVFRILGPLEVFQQERYAYIPSVLLLGAFAVLASQRREGEELTGKIAVTVICAHAVVVLAISYTDVQYRNAGTDWAAEVDAARAECREADADDATAVLLQANKLGFFPVHLTCGDLD